MSNIINLPPNNKSGVYKAPSHAEGGVQVIVDGTRKVEVEGQEFHLCRKSLESEKQYEFKNKTNLEILEKIFQNNHCQFRQGFANSGDFILCKLVVNDKKKRDIHGTAKDIINVLQSEKSCKVTDDAADTYNNRLGGKLNDNETLVGVHNLWVEYLVFADEMGGLPMPSLAIINPNIPFVKYGEITLVAPKEMYDPKESAKNKVFNRDVYSPRFPTVYFKANKKTLAKNFSKYIVRYGEDTPFLKSIEDNRIQKLVYDGFAYVYDKIEQGKGTIRKIIADVEHSMKFLLAYAYAKDIRVPIEYKYLPLPKILGSEPQQKGIEFIKNLIEKKYPELKEIKHYNHDDKKSIKIITDFYIQLNSDIKILRIRYANGRKAIDDIIVDLGKEHIEKNVNKDGEIYYATGVEVITEIQALYKSEKIVNESKLRDYFEESKFYEKNESEIKNFLMELSDDAIENYYFIQSPSGRKVPLTLENVERYMKSQGIKSTENFFYGLSNSAAIAAKEYKSLSAAKADFDKVISDDEFQKFLANQQELIDKADEVRKYYKYQDSSNSFYTALGKVGQYDNPSNDLIQKIFRGEDFNDIPETYMDDIRNAAISIRNAPTEYFEVKLKKSVKLNEFVGAVVPEHFTEGIEILKKNGIKVIETYKYDDDKDKKLKNRMTALKKVIEKTDVENQVTFKDGGEVEVEVFNNIGLFNTDFSTIYFADKKGGFSYPEVKLVNENDVLSYQEPLPHSVVVVFDEKESLTPDYIQLNEIKFVVVPEPMVNDIKPILNKNGVKFVTYDTKSPNLKEAKLNAVKSLLK